MGHDNIIRGPLLDVNIYSLDYLDLDSDYWRIKLLNWKTDSENLMILNCKL